jgi:hypothetical protein
MAKLHLAKSIPLHRISSHLQGDERGIFFAAFAPLREIFRFFGCGFAALCPSW